MKTVKKLLAVLLITLLAFTAIAPAKSFAEDGITLTITAPADSNIDITAKTIAVYKLFNLTTTGEGDNKTYHYSWNGIGATEEFFKQLTDESGKNLGLDTVIEATEYVRDLSGTALTTLAEEYYTFCQGRTDAVTVTKVATESKVFTGLDAGYYLVYDIKTSADDTTARSVAILSNLEASTTIQLKIETVDVDKTVDQTSANVGDTVNFTIKSKVPDTTGYTTYTFVVEDTLSEGLTLLDPETDTATTATTVVVKVDGVVKTEGEDGDYTKEINTAADGKTTLKITFNSDEFLKYEKDDEIEITYSARLNDKAAEAVENSNEVKITYSNDPTNSSSTTTTPTDIVKVYTYTVDLTKKNVDGETLTGAKFVLQDSNGKYIVFDVDDNGKYIYSGTQDTITEDIKLVTDANGKLVISGLKAGSYKLIETDAPSTEYAVPNFSFDFTITETKVPVEEGSTELKVVDSTFTYTPAVDAAKGYITVTGGNTAKDEEGKNIETPVLNDDFQITVLNARKSDLPATGGIGTTIFVVVGIALMAVAGIALVVRNKKNK